MMRETLLLLLIVGQFSIIYPQKREDVESFNRLKSRMITDSIIKNISAQKCPVTFDSANLPQLFFRLNGTDLTAHVEKLKMLPPKCVQIQGIDTNIFHSRMDLSVAFPVVTLRGTVTFGQRTVAYEEKYPFGVIVRNVTGSGICITRWTEIGYRLLECNLDYNKSSAEEDKFPLPGEKEILVADSVKRIWKPLTNALNEKLTKAVDSLLQRLRLGRFLRDRIVFEKYRNYVIESTETANDFVDGIMEAVRRIMNEKFHDTFPIPNIEESFRRKGLLITWQGSFKADHGTIHGLSTLSRVGDTLFATDNASRTHFYGNLSFEHLDLHYDRYRAEFMNMGPTGTLNTRLRPINVYIHPCVNFNTGKIHLEHFEIGDVGEVTIEVTGMGKLLSWIASTISTWVAALTTDKILNHLQIKYDNYIKSLLTGYTIDEITGGKFIPN